MIKTAIGIIAVFVLIGFSSLGLKGCGGGEKKTTETGEQVTPVIPCMCDEQNLVFSHLVSDVRLSQQQKHTWDRPYGYEIRWCAYNGKVKQLTRNGETVMTLEAVEGNPLVMVRYYTKKH